MRTAGARPLIGVTTYRQTTSWWSWERDAALVPGTYLDMVEAAGGRPLLLPPSGPEPSGPDHAGGRTGGAAELDHMVALLDGLVLIGGGDVDADRYGQQPDPRNGGTNPRRDDLELGLVDAALARDLPLLAICRGMQLLNVALGGELVQQLSDVLGPNPHQPGPGVFGPIEVVTTEGSGLRRVFGVRAEVQCSHHQAVSIPGRGLEVTATSADGIIEAVELPGYRFVVGVQWHPEEAGGLGLFEAFVSAARAPAAPASAPAATAPSAAS
jgi:gamma-glutamyl-gamma-aminobutyrate hydrolase PuuD